MIKVKDALLDATHVLECEGIDTAHLDVRILLEDALEKPLSYILANPDLEIHLWEYYSFGLSIARRASHEPMAYIMRKKEFYGYEFQVNTNVLIPRADSETLIDAVLSKYPRDSQNKKLKVLELGVGSGCLIISLLLEMRNIIAVAVDISRGALRVAKANAKNHKVEGKLRLFQSDWFTNIALGKKFDLIIANPPYISENHKSLMAKETILCEPKLALFAGNDGLAAYEIIAQNAKDYLNDKGSVIVEIGINQAQAVIAIFTKYKYKLNQIKQDLAKIDRVLIFSLES